MAGSFLIANPLAEFKLCHMVYHIVPRVKKKLCPEKGLNICSFSNKIETSGEKHDRPY